MQALKRLLVLNQYYRPGPEATAQLLAELCEGLAEKYEITVVAGTTAGAGTGRMHLNGVDVIRVPSTAFPRRRLTARGVNYLTYLVLASLRALAFPRPDLVLCQTDPPIVGAAAYLVARRFGVPLVAVVKDLYPETAVQLGKLSERHAAAALRRLIDLYLRGAERVVVIGETMRSRLEERGVERERLRVVPDWVDTEVIHPVERDLRGRFVVMHAGNMGHAQDLDTLIEAARLLGDGGVEFELVGDGARREELERLAAGLDAVSFLPYRPREQLSEVLSGASLHFVGLASGLSGYVVPSRLYGVLAAGRPVLVAADESSEPAQLVHRVGCGIVVPPGHAEQVAAEIRAAKEGKHDLEAMGRRGRDFVVASAGRPAAIRAYDGVLTEILGP
jgi:glycosyltransferase involved in cell wall biosynthesis